MNESKHKENERIIRSGLPADCHILTSRLKCFSVFDLWPLSWRSSVMLATCSESSSDTSHHAASAVSPFFTGSVLTDKRRFREIRRHNRTSRSQSADSGSGLYDSVLMLCDGGQSAAWNMKKSNVEKLVRHIRVSVRTRASEQKINLWKLLFKIQFTDLNQSDTKF